ncbi:MAG: hypothetical protein Q4B70_01035 [Lachnospiraceae bacterium]|nr:hypothetical protein [Lachnospiraceae bacterium]
MKKVMTNQKIVAIVNSITSMQNREDEAIKNGGQKLFGSRTKVTYAIRKNKEKLLELLKPYNEEREILLKECNKEEAQKNNTINIKEGFEEKWQQGIKDLLNIELEVEVHEIPFQEVEGLSLGMSDMEAIDFMLTDPEEFK